MFFINGVIPQKTTLYKSDSEGRLGVWAGNSIKYFLNITCVKILKSEKYLVAKCLIREKDERNHCPCTIDC